MYRIKSNIEPILTYNIPKDIDDQDYEPGAAYISCVLINSFKMYLITAKPNFNFEYDKKICYFNVYYSPEYEGKDDQDISDLTKIGIYEIIIKDAEVPEVPDLDNPKSLLFFPWVASRISSKIYPVKTLKDITDDPQCKNKKLKLIKGIIDDPPDDEEESDDGIEESDSDDDFKKAIQLSLLDMGPLGSSTNWVNDYLKSSQYKIISNEGGGNCFFLALANALKSKLSDREKTDPNIIAPIILETLTKMGIGNPIESIDALKALSLNFDPKNTSQKNSTGFALRVLLYLSASEDEFTEQKELSDQIVATELSDLEKNISAVIEAQHNPPSTLTPIELINFQEKKTGELLEYIKLTENPADLLPPELKDFYRLKDFGNYQDYLLTDKFWADTYAINKLELFLNIKFIIFKYNEPDSSIECLPSLTHASIEKEEVFNPQYYVMINWIEPLHYELIEYDGQAIFNWSNLPKRVKEIIIEKCSDKDSGGSFKYIPEIIADKPITGGKLRSKKNKHNKQRITRKKLI